MATQIVGAQTKWTGGRDDEGHRTYYLYIQTLGTPLDGPEAHLRTPGLPLPGSIWVYDNDNDPYAWCNGAAELTPREGQGAANIVYDHKYTFSSKPRGKGKKDDRGARKKCADVTIQDPLMEPPKTNGGSLRNTEDYQFDLAGRRIRATSFEPFFGPQVVFDRSRRQVMVEWNDLTLDLATIEPLIDTVNISTMWDLPARCWKLCEFHWDRKLYGECYFYYTKKFVFESNVRTWPLLATAFQFMDFDNTIGFINPGDTFSGWDHYVPDVTSLATSGHFQDANDGNGPKWITDNFLNGATQVVPVFTNPNHYVPIMDYRSKKNLRRCLSRTNRGQPATGSTDENIFRIRVYPDSDFFSKLRNLPTSL